MIHQNSGEEQSFLWVSFCGLAFVATRVPWAVKRRAEILPAACDWAIWKMSILGKMLCTTQKEAAKYCL